MINITLARSRVKHGMTVLMFVSFMKNFLTKPVKHILPLKIYKPVRLISLSFASLNSVHALLESVKQKPTLKVSSGFKTSTSYKSF